MVVLDHSERRNASFKTFSVANPSGTPKASPDPFRSIYHCQYWAHDAESDAAPGKTLVLLATRGLGTGCADARLDCLSKPSQKNTSAVTSSACHRQVDRAGPLGITSVAAVDASRLTQVLSGVLNQFRNNIAGNIGQAVVASLKVESQSLVVQAKQMQNRGVDVVNRNGA
jgi:hypothetical protein